jgi:hypothetical protein
VVTTAHFGASCVDEKSQIQALDGTMPVPPMQPGLSEASSHDCARQGTTTLRGTGHRHRAGDRGAEAAAPDQEFLAFLKQIERTYRHVLDPDGQPVELHLVMDNYAAHKRKNVHEWLQANPRFEVHFTPSHASWMNLVEVWFGIVERQAIRRGVFKLVKDLNTKVQAFIDGRNDRSHPFVWIKTAEQVHAKAILRGLQMRGTRTPVFAGLMSLMSCLLAAGSHAPAGEGRAR